MVKRKSVNGVESHFAPKPGCSFSSKWGLKGQVHCLCCWKSIRKGKQIHKSQNFAKIHTNSSLSIGIDGSCVSYAELAPAARCLFHLGLPEPALPPLIRLLQLLFRFYFLLLLRSSVGNFVNPEVDSLRSPAVRARLAPLLLSWCSSSTSRSASGSCRCSRTGTFRNPDLPGRVGFVVQVWIADCRQG